MAKSGAARSVLSSSSLEGKIEKGAKSKNVLRSTELLVWLSLSLMPVKQEDFNHCFGCRVQIAASVVAE